MIPRSPGRPLLRTKKGPCSEQGLNPKGYANETPLLLFKCLIYITIAGFRHRQVPREFPAQIRPSVLGCSPPRERYPEMDPIFLFSRLICIKAHHFQSQGNTFFSGCKSGSNFISPP